MTRLLVERARYRRNPPARPLRPTGRPLATPTRDLVDLLTSRAEQEGQPLLPWQVDYMTSMLRAIASGRASLRVNL